MASNKHAQPAARIAHRSTADFSAINRAAFAGATEEVAVVRIVYASRRDFSDLIDKTFGAAGSVS